MSKKHWAIGTGEVISNNHWIQYNTYNQAVSHKTLDTCCMDA